MGHDVRRNAEDIPTARILGRGLRFFGCGVALIVTALTFFPVLALGPLAEGLV